MMEALRLILLFFHLVGMAAILGGLFAGLRSGDRKVSLPMLNGAITQVVTGIALAWVREAAHMANIQAKLGVKLGLAVVVLILAVYGVRGKSQKPSAFMAVGVLAAINTAVAVFWR